MIRCGTHLDKKRAAPGAALPDVVADREENQGEAGYGGEGGGCRAAMFLQEPLHSRDWGWCWGKPQVGCPVSGFRKEGVVAGGFYLSINQTIYLSGWTLSTF